MGTGENGAGPKPAPPPPPVFATPLPFALFVAFPPPPGPPVPPAIVTGKRWFWL